MKRFVLPVSWILAAAGLLVPSVARAQTTYNVFAGAETKDESVQADAFLPNEVWLLEGDSIKWTFAPVNEPHTVTFLTAGQARPGAPPPAGPPFAVAHVPCNDLASYDGSACVSTLTGLNGGATFTVKFPKAGNYKFVCLIHTDMTGTVHVLANTAENSALIHSQHYYDEQARDETQALLSDNDHQGEDDRRWSDRRDDDNYVNAGVGEIVATAGGLQYRASVRFFPQVIRIHAGESIVWANLDPTEPHTVTFGDEPMGFVPTLFSLPPTIGYPAASPALCSSTLTTNCQNADTGTILATINCTTSPTATAGTTPCDAAFKPQENSVTPPPPPYDPESFLSSGFLQAAEPDRTGTPQVPPGTTRIRITFPNKGIYTYHCALHDVDGMYGTVIVE